MDLFKEIYCADCGEKTKIFFRTKMTDEKYVCSKCLRKIPHYIRQSVKDNYSFSEYIDLKDYIANTSRELKLQFCETHHFHSLHLDAIHRIFYFGFYYEDKNNVFFRLRNINDIDLAFEPETYKEGMLSYKEGKVKGDVRMKLKMNVPAFVYETTIASNVKAYAKETFFGSKVKYDNPKGMDEFIDAFRDAWEEDCDDYSE